MQIQKLSRKQFAPWYNRNGKRLEYFHLALKVQLRTHKADGKAVYRSCAPSQAGTCTIKNCVDIAAWLASVTKRPTILIRSALAELSLIPMCSLDANNFYDCAMSNLSQLEF